MQRHTTLFRRLARVGGTVALGLVLGAANASAATTAVDLMTANSSATLSADLGGTFIVQQIDPQSTGTGVIDSFLRIQQTGSESGFNTDANPPLDAKAGAFTRELLLSEVPTVTIGSTVYREFILDINQNGNELLSLNQLQFFVASDDPGNTFTYTATGDTGVTQLATIGSGATAGTEVFRMSSLANPYDLQLNYALNAGSGSGDYRFLIASSLFGNATNVILYSQFGTPGAYSSNDGFEEWSVLQGVSTGPGNIDVVPEPASLLLLGTGMGFLARRVRRRKATA